MTDQETPPRRWVVDTRIPVATIILLIAQAVGSVWYFSWQMSTWRQELTNLTTTVVRIDQQGSPITRERLVGLEQARSTQDDRLQRIEATVAKINDKLDFVLTRDRRENK